MAMSIIRTLLKRNLYPKYNINLNRYTSNASTKLEAEDEENKPIAYTKSPAVHWQAKSSRIGTDSERLWYEPYVIFVSIGVFMVYFCILREESDIDSEFDKTLYNRIKGLEEKQLLLSLEYNRRQGLETKAIEERLQEIEQSKE